MSCGSTNCTSASTFSSTAHGFERERLSPVPLLQRLRELARVYDRWQQRRALLELDDRMLADIGVSREQAEREADKFL